MVWSVWLVRAGRVTGRKRAAGNFGRAANSGIQIIIGTTEKIYYKFSSVTRMFVSSRIDETRVLAIFKIFSSSSFVKLGRYEIESSKTRFKFGIMHLPVDTSKFPSLSSSLFS